MQVQVVVECLFILGQSNTFIYLLITYTSLIYIYIYIYRRSDLSVPLVYDAVSETRFENSTFALHEFSNCLSCIDEYIRSLVDLAVENIPEKHHEDTYIYLKATAGMRLLSEIDQENILNEVRKTISTYNFVFSNQNEQVKVITGGEEGVFGWITVNYLLETILEEDKRIIIIILLLIINNLIIYRTLWNNGFRRSFNSISIYYFL